MKRILRIVFTGLCLFCFSHAGRAEDYYNLFLRHVGTNDGGNGIYFWRGDEVRAPLLVDTNNTAPKLTKSKLTELTLHPQVAVSGVRLGMTMERVVSTWGKPIAVSSYNHGAPRLSYRESRFASDSYAGADVLFSPGSNSVIAIWLVFPMTYGKPFLSPSVEECIKVLGEPTLRNYVPDPFEPHPKPPKHWYCRMVYKDLPLVLYFSNGQLMALEINPQAKGVAQGEGSDDYSIQFCLIE